MSEARTLALISSLYAAKTEAELVARMKDVAREIGYDHVLFGIELRLPVVGTMQHVTSAFPEAYQILYQQRAFIAKDPTVAHCQGSGEPLIWRQQMYEGASNEIMEESRKFGLSHGISLPVHERGKISSMLSLGRDQPFASEAEREYVLSAGNILAHSLHFASENLILPDLLQERRPHLSPRERECFQLVAHGKSNWDIGQLLAISEAAAAFHVKNVLKKLRVSTRMQAVAIGVALGMIT